MPNTILCHKCGTEIEISKALEDQLRGKIAGEERDKIVAEVQEKAFNKARLENELAIKRLRDEAEENKENNRRLKVQLEELLEEMKLLRRAKDEAELVAKKKLMEEEEKIKTEARKSVLEEQELKDREKDKKLSDALKQIEEMKTKIQQGSQQLQGEVQEEDLKLKLMSEFPDDFIEDVEKGIRGADLKQTVRTNRGTVCGVIMWESKRTKAWTEEWITKLKEDMRKEEANVAVIVTSVLPKDFSCDFGFRDGVYVTSPKLAVAIACPLRDRLVEVARQKHYAQNKGDKADLIYGYLTGHEFSQQVMAMAEAYQEMLGQIEKERMAYEKSWKLREGQAKRMITATANIYGKIQGIAGVNSLPSLAILELESGQEQI